MSIAQLSNILKFLTGAAPTQEEREHIFKETLLMALARASDADQNVAPVEVDTIRAVIKSATGEDVSAAEVRVAAASELYERGSLEHHLAGVARHLSAAQRVAIVNSLAQVIHSDVQVSDNEVQFFNMVAGALKVTPAELAGLYA